MHRSLIVLFIALSGCAATLPRPLSGPIPAGLGKEVPYPPPSGRVETIPHITKVGDVWIDGQWDWDGKAWNWTSGSWVAPIPDAYFTPWTTRRLKDGRLFFERAGWRSKDGKRIGGAASAELCELPNEAKSP